MPLVKHFVHFANAAAVGYVHADKRAEFVDEFVRAFGFLFLRHADKRNAVLRERTAHKLPVVAVARGDNRAALRRIFVARQMFQPDNFDVALHGLLEFWEGQNFHEHCAELNGTFAGNAFGFFGRDVQTADYIFRRKPFSFARQEQPNKFNQSTTEAQAKFQRQQTN